MIKYAYVIVLLIFLPNICKAEYCEYKELPPLKEYSSKEGVSEEDNKKEIELSLKKACKEIINKYKTDPSDIDFSSLGTEKIEVSGSKKIIAASSSNNQDIKCMVNDDIQGTIVYNETKNTYYYILGKDEQEGAVILCPFIDKPKLEQGKYIQLGFDAVDVANYMAREIENNLNSSAAQDIIESSNLSYNILKEYMIVKQYDFVDILMKSYTLPRKIYASADLLIIVSKPYRLFYDAVKTNSFWDHKWQLSALFPSMGLSRRYYHMYNNTEIYYDMWSNIHFGVIGRYCKFSEITLLLGADAAQKWSNSSFSEGDTECDKNSIKIGFSIYDEYIKGNLISAGNILTHIDSNDFFKHSYYKGECKDDESKK